MQRGDRSKLSAEDRLTVNSEPLVEYGRVDLAEVGVEFDVSVLKVVQAGVFADQARCDSVSSEEYWGGGSVVGAFAGVFPEASAELAERHGQNSVAVAVFVEVVDERVECSAEFSQQCRMGWSLS